MNYAKRALLVSLLGISLIPSVASGAQGRGRGQGNGHGSDKAAKVNNRDETIAVDRDGHRRIVREYYTRQALPPNAKLEGYRDALR